VLNMRLRKIRMTFLVLCVCMLAVSLTGCGNALKAGIKQMESGDYQKAAESFQKVIDKGEDTKEVYRGLGMALYEQGDYAGALSALQTGLDNGMEETPQMYNLMGLSAMETGDYASAAQYFVTGTALADARASEETIDGELLREMRFNAVVCYEKALDWANAKEKAAEYLEDYPDDEEMIREAEFLQTR